MSQLHIIFPVPGVWTRFKLVAQWQDAEGYHSTRSHRSVPEELLPTLQAVVERISGLQEPWQATLVQASLGGVETPSGGGSAVVELCVCARRADGARKAFTSTDYPQLRLTDEASIAFFRHFTQGELGGETQAAEQE